jgi:dihydrofolate reductase
MLTLIVAVNKLNYISKDNKMVWHIKEDLDFFYKTIENSNIICGKNTWKNIQKSRLENVNVAVISTRKNTNITDYPKIINSTNEVINFIKVSKKKNNFACGGLDVYDSFLKDKLISDFIITEINDLSIGDKKFDINNYLNILKYDITEIKKTVYGLIKYGKISYF